MYIEQHTGFSWIHDPDLQIVTKRLNTCEWYFVGGCVRDSLLHILTFDIDITTNIQPEEVLQRMHGLSTTTIGQRFGTIGVFVGKWKVEITTTRSDIDQDGRHTNVKFLTSFYEDSCRRDFTMNALLCDGKTIIDYHHGIDDLLNGCVRFIGSAIQRMQEDYLRIIRYIRFFFRFDKGSLQYLDEIRQCLPGLHAVSKERFISEVLAICKHVTRTAAIQALNKLQLSYNMFNMDLNTDELNLLYLRQFNDQDYILATLFRYANYEQQNALPLSRTVKRLVNWLQTTTTVVDQLAHVYTISKRHMLYLCIMMKDIWYPLLQDKVFNRIDVMQYEPVMRGVMQQQNIKDQMCRLIDGVQ
jgi:tRNA nucleotidyltransferase/poly(A) polymerase